MKKSLIVAAGLLLALVAVDYANAQTGGRGILFQARFNAGTANAVDRTAYDKIKDWISVKDYGATGTGVTNDETAVQQAITNAGSAGLIQFPCPGSYLTTSYGTLDCGIYYPPLAGGSAIPRSVPGKLFDSVSVKDFGAKGTGLVNDTTAIQAAITYAQNLGTIGIVRFPCGTYLTDQITISSSNMILQGDSRQCSILKENSASDTGMVNFTGGPLTNIILQELTFDDNSKTPTMNAYQSGNAPVNPGINFGAFAVGTDITNLIVQNCTFTGFDNAIYTPNGNVGVGVTLMHNSQIINNIFTGLSPSAQKDHVAIRVNADNTLIQGNYLSGWTNGINPTIYATTNKVLGNYILQPANGADVGIYASSGARTLIADNYIEMNSSTNATSDGCIKLGGAANPVSSFADVHDNICIRGMIKVSNAADSTVHHNQISATLNTGCGSAICVSTDAANPRIVISGNIINGNSGAGIYSQSTNAVSITDNFIDTPTTQGIRLAANTGGWIIANNRIREPGLQCIYVDGSTNGNIVGNLCLHSATSAQNGIRVGGSSTSVVVVGNNVSGFSRGLQFDTGTNQEPTVIGNNFTANTNQGIFADGSAPNALIAWNNNYNSAAVFFNAGIGLTPGANYGSTTLTSGTPSTKAVTVAGNVTHCVCTNETTQANPVKCNVATPTLTITGPNTVTDNVSYFCW